MKVYQFTESQYEALLKDLELQKFKTQADQCSNEVSQQTYLSVIDNVHRRFHYHVVRFFQDS